MEDEFLAVALDNDTIVLLSIEDSYRKYTSPTPTLFPITSLCLYHERRKLVVGMEGSVHLYKMPKAKGGAMINLTREFYLKDNSKICKIIPARIEPETYWLIMPGKGIYAVKISFNGKVYSVNFEGYYPNRKRFCSFSDIKEVENNFIIGAALCEDYGDVSSYHMQAMSKHFESYQVDIFSS